MKPTLLLLAITGLLFFSCRRDDASKPALLAGNWRMTLAKDNTSGIAVTKPANTGGDVDITFISSTDTSGNFYGHTPTNNISLSDYTTGFRQQLQVLFLSITKVAETDWGSEFVDNIRSATRYSFEDGKLIIETERKTLFFERQ